MAKHAKQNKEVEDQYEFYRKHLDSEKTADGQLLINEEKKNQANFYSGSSRVTAEAPWGNTSSGFKIKKDDELHYTITYKTDALKDGLLCRLDAGAGTHRNYAPDIPLALSSVPTPHFHSYRDDGYDIATPIPGLDYSDESSTKFDYVDGFSYFCHKLHITGPEGERPSVVYSPPGILPLQLEDNDPNANVDFPD